MEQLLKLTKQLNVKNIVADSTQYNADKEKQEKNKKFLNAIKEDIYVDEAVKVTDNMIGQSNLATNVAPANKN